MVCYVLMTRYAEITIVFPPTNISCPGFVNLWVRILSALISRDGANGLCMLKMGKVGHAKTRSLSAHGDSLKILISRVQHYKVKHHGLRITDLNESFCSPELTQWISQWSVIPFRLKWDTIQPRKKLCFRNISVGRIVEIIACLCNLCGFYATFVMQMI